MAKSFPYFWIMAHGEYDEAFHSYIQLHVEEIEYMLTVWSYMHLRMGIIYREQDVEQNYFSTFLVYSEGRRVVKALAQIQKYLT